MSIDRLVTLAILLLGLALVYLVIPGQVESVDYGSIVPASVPTAVSWLIVACAGIQVFTDHAHTQVNLAVIARTFLFLGLIALGVYLMPRFGFEYIAPAIAFLVLVLIRERRWYWYLVAVLVIPVGVWLIVERLLGRMLP